MLIKITLPVTKGVTAELEVRPEEMNENDFVAFGFRFVICRSSANEYVSLKVETLDKSGRYEEIPLFEFIPNEMNFVSTDFVVFMFRDR